MVKGMEEGGPLLGTQPFCYLQKGRTLEELMPGDYSHGGRKERMKGPGAGSYGSPYPQTLGGSPNWENETPNANRHRRKQISP